MRHHEITLFVIGVLFTLFDAEVDPRLKADIKETLVSLLQSLASENLLHWLSMCKQVLLASKAESGKGQIKKEEKGIICFFTVHLCNFSCVTDC